MSVQCVRGSGAVPMTEGAQGEEVLDTSPVPARSRDGWPTISVCICTHARPHYIVKCLDGLREQTVGLDGFELVIVDSGSPADAAAAIAALASSFPNARLVRVDRAGVSIARNAGARAASGDYLAYIDDDAIPAPDWVEQISRVILEEERPPAVLGGRVLPLWERPLPSWWPESLLGVLSIIDVEGSGEYRTPDLPRETAPWSVNMIVDRAAMLELGGFSERLGRLGELLLSDEDVHLAWRLQDSGRPARYDSRIIVRHNIQASRLSPEWLVTRLYWQGFSTVLTRAMMQERQGVRREFRRRLAVETLCAPAGLLPKGSTKFLPLRWRLAYAKGFTRAALGCALGKRASLYQSARRLLGRPAAATVPALIGGAIGMLDEPGGDPGHPAPPPATGTSGRAGAGPHDHRTPC